MCMTASLALTGVGRVLAGITCPAEEARPPGTKWVWLRQPLSGRAKVTVASRFRGPTVPGRGGVGLPGTEPEA